MLDGDEQPQLAQLSSVIPYCFNGTLLFLVTSSDKAGTHTSLGLLSCATLSQVTQVSCRDSINKNLISRLLVFRSELVIYNCMHYMCSDPFNVGATIMNGVYTLFV